MGGTRDAVGEARAAISRRGVLAAGGLATLGAALAACSGSSTPTAGSSSAGDTASTTGDTSATSAAPSTASSSTATTGTTAASVAPIVTLDAATTAELDTIFDTALQATGLVGGAAAVWIGDQVWARAGGVRDLQTQEPFSPDDHVRIASITKTFTATATLQIVDDGGLTLDDPLEKFVPGVANGDTITVYDLLGMRSGVYDFTSNQAFLDMFDADPTMPWSDEQTLAIINANPPAFAPGEKVVYCDSNYALLGMIIKKVTGQEAGAVITERIIDALPLANTSYPTGVEMPDPHATGYVPDVADPGAPFDNAARPPTVVTELNPAIPGTAGAMISKLGDLRLWAQELAVGSLLQPATQEERLAAFEKFDGQTLNFGYGLGITRLNDFLGHDGAVLGYSTVTLRRPDTDTTIAMVSNESNNFTTPTLTVALEIIKYLDPDQLR